MQRKKRMFVIGMLSLPGTLLGHEVNQRLGSSESSMGESRSMAQMQGRADAPPMLSGDLQSNLTLSANVERVRVDGESNSDYMKENFPSGQRVDRAFGFDSSWTFSKRTEATVGGNFSGDGVTKTTTQKIGFGQWFLGDQVRIGISGSSSETTRPPDEILDLDHVTINLKSRVVSNSVGTSIKAILNPTTVVAGDYSQVRSTERPVLKSWSAGVKQFIPPCDCAVHGDFARVINLGNLNTNMSSGELTGTQVTLSFLQALWRGGHSRTSYRYSREDEYTRAYRDHLVFGADSYTQAISQEFEKVKIGGQNRPLIMDLAATRYIHNQGGGASTFEMGAAVKF